MATGERQGGFSDQLGTFAWSCKMEQSTELLPCNACPWPCPAFFCRAEVKTADKTLTVPKERGLLELLQSPNER